MIRPQEFSMKSSASQPTINFGSNTQPQQREEDLKLLDQGRELRIGSLAAEQVG